MAGLTVNGFERKRIVDIVADLEADMKLTFGNNIDLSAQSVFGQFIGIMSEIISDQWQSQEEVYNSQYPSTAQENQLSNVVQYNGLIRQEATKSFITAPGVTLTGTPGTVIPAGSLVSVDTTGFVFETDTLATIGGGGTITVGVTAVETGAIEAVTGTLTVIDTAIFGWTAVTNTSDATVGSAEETDAELRARRNVSTQLSGQNLSEALFGQLLNIENVIAAVVIENKTNVVDANGVPPHSFECVVQGGLEADIVETIWSNTPIGILSHGNIPVVIVDALGNNQTVSYSRPIEIDIYHKIDITVDTAVFPSTGVDDIKAAVTAYGTDNFSIGDDVIYDRFYIPIQETPGILTIDLFMGLAASPSGTANLPIALTEISDYSTVQVEVNIV